MKPYRDTHGDSGISAYECGVDWIDIQFKGGNTYRYRAAEVGSASVRAMKRLAETGDGLNTYINAHPKVKDSYSEKW